MDLSSIDARVKVERRIVWEGLQEIQQITFPTPHSLFPPFRVARDDVVVNKLVQLLVVGSGVLIFLVLSISNPLC